MLPGVVRSAYVWRRLAAAIALGAVATLSLACRGVARGAEANERGGDDERPQRSTSMHEPAPAKRDRGFLGRPERMILDGLTQATLVGAKKGGGGRSLGFKLHFQGGGKAYYKPAQTFSGTNWYAEVVAHYLDRALGLGRVPPVVARRFQWAELRSAADEDRRIDEVHVREDGTVDGALIHWLSGGLERANTPPGWENWVRIEPFSRFEVTPFQRPVAYAHGLKTRKQRRRDGLERVAFFDEPPRPDRPERPAELSDMLVFDFLTLNIDRWGGNNVNVLTLGEGGPLIHLDNAAGFSQGPPRRGLMDARLTPCQRFRASTFKALKALSIEELRRELARDPLAPLMSDRLIDGIEIRRRAVLEHIAALRGRHGDAEVLPW